MERDPYKTSRRIYIVEAALEYFISILVGGAYLARLATELGISDSVTGILTSLISLGCSFQIIAIFLFGNRSAKRLVTVMHSINQLCFALIYLVPFFDLPKGVKIAAFVVLLLLGHVVNNVVQSPKINWFMSLVDDRERGRFTALKEIVSLIGGVVFSFVMGSLMDMYEARGEIKSSFIVCGIALFVLMLLHTASLIGSREKPAPIKAAEGKKHLFAELVGDKSFLKIILVSVLWNVATYTSTPFYGTYQIKELGFSMVFVSVLSTVHAVCRSCFSLPLGRYADRHSFAKMLNICFFVAMVGFAVQAFTVPANGKLFYTAYYLLYAVGMAGINSGSINLIYERVSVEKRVCALALKNTLAGLAGFGATLLSGMLVEHIQTNGNLFLGMPLYAQQVTSAISAAVVAGILVYLNTVVRKLPLAKDID